MRVQKRTKWCLYMDFIEFSFIKIRFDDVSLNVFRTITNNKPKVIKVKQHPFHKD